jgi:drug/metabolite transporter (DMT)-like permease
LNTAPKISLAKTLETYKPTPLVAYCLVTLSCFLWGLATVVGRGIYEEIPPFGLSFWRWLLAALVLLPLVWVDLPRKLPLIKANIKLIALLGFFQVGASAILLVALNYTTAINASLINAAQPVMTIIPAWILTREKITFGQGIGIILGLVGVVIMVSQGNLDILKSLEFNGGDIFAIMAVLGWTIYATLIHRVPSELGLTTTLFLVYLAGTIGLVPFYIVEHTFIRPVPLSWLTVGVVALLGIVVAAIAVSIWTASVRSIGPNRAAIFLNVIPVFGVSMAIIFLGEQLFTFHLIGAAFIGTGMALVIFMARKKLSKKRE